MDKFGFIGHPIEIKDFYKLNSAIRFIPNKILESSLKWIPPFKVSEIRGIRSTTGKEIGGFLIGCPLLPKQMLELDEDFVLQKIIAAGKIAERLGAEIIGLGGYTSIVGDKGYTIAENLKTPVTSGNSYTAYSTCEAVCRMGRAKNLDLKTSTVAVIGATGSIGSLCTKKLSECVGKIIINARHRAKLESLQEEVHNRKLAEVTVEEITKRAVKNADIVITTTSAPEALFDIEDLKLGAIVCDVSVPKNIAGRNNPKSGITIIEGGLIKLPYPPDFGVDIGLPQGIVYACMAETMLLTLEGKFVSYSLGDAIGLDKLDEIAAIGFKHGFEVFLPNIPLH